MEIELAFDASTVENIETSGWEKEEGNGMIYLVPEKDNHKQLKITGNDGTVSQIILLSREQAENCWRVKIGEQESILITEADVMINQDEIEFRQLGNHLISFDIFPAPKLKLMSRESELQPINNRLFKRFQIKLEELKISVEMDNTNEKNVSIKIPESLPYQLEDLIWVATRNRL